MEFLRLVRGLFGVGIPQEPNGPTEQRETAKMIMLNHQTRTNHENFLPGRSVCKGFCAVESVSTLCASSFASGNERNSCLFFQRT